MQARVGFVLLGCVLAGLGAGAAQETPATDAGGPVVELLTNGSFEDLDSAGSPIGWRAEGLLVPGVKVDAASLRSGRLGSKVLRMRSETSPAQVACFNGPFDVREVAGRQLEVSCFYRTVGRPGGYMDFDTYAEPFAEKGWETPHLTLEQHALEETPAWTLLTWRLRCPAEAREAVLIIGVTGDGEVCVDDVSVRLAESPVRMEPEVLGDLVAWPQRRELRLTIVNDTPEARDLRVNVGLAAKGARPPRPAAVKVGPGAHEDVVLNYNLPTDAPHGLSLSLDDAAAPIVYDALVVEIPALLTGRIVQPNFRGTLLASIPVEEFVIEGRIAASESLCSEVALEAELGGAGRIATEGQGLTRPDGPASWRLAFPREGMLTGTYWLNVTALRQGKVVATLPLELSRAAARDHEVGLDAEGRLLVAGKPVFVNGLSNVSQPNDVDRAAAQGFNLVVVPTAAAAHDLLERVNALGLMMIVYSPIPAQSVDGSVPTFWEHMVHKYGENPGVVAWQLQGAPDAALVRTAAFRSQQEHIATIDCYHPTLTRLSIPSLLPVYAPYCEIIGVESQPMPAMGVETVVADLEAARAAARPGQPVWAVVQAVGRAWLLRGGGLEKGLSGRPPTGPEHRAMALLAVAHGAQGLLHRGYLFGASRDRDEYLLPKDAPELWESMRATNAIVTQLSEALAGGAYRGAAVTGGVHVGAWEHQGRLLVLAVNAQPAAALTTFAVPGATPGGLRRLDDGSEVLKTERGQFADDLPALGGRAYIADLSAP
ncbi:MAG: hypothetical protein FJX74_09275 [Armatimonadetes bacterium]|nr:hypothetical protein [Armatimonadota bacterium]